MAKHDCLDKKAVQFASSIVEDIANLHLMVQSYAKNVTIGRLHKGTHCCYAFQRLIFFGWLTGQADAVGNRKCGVLFKKPIGKK